MIINGKNVYINEIRGTYAKFFDVKPFEHNAERISDYIERAYATFKKCESIESYCEQYNVKSVEIAQKLFSFIE